MRSNKRTVITNSSHIHSSIMISSTTPFLQCMLITSSLLQGEAFSTTSQYSSNVCLDLNSANRRGHSTNSGMLKHNPTIQYHSSQLFYRALDEDDDDGSISMLSKRAAPTFNKSQVRRVPDGISSAKRGGINTPLILSLLINQILILTFFGGLTVMYVFLSGNEQFLSDGIFNWSGNLDAPSAQLDLSITPIRLMQGILGAVPTIALSNFIERSDDRRFATTNFSTIYMVMTLFGRRTSASKVDEEKVKIDRMEPFTNTVGELI